MKYEIQNTDEIFYYSKIIQWWTFILKRNQVEFSDSSGNLKMNLLHVHTFGYLFMSI